jgi:hypothetical protein
MERRLMTRFRALPVLVAGLFILLALPTEVSAQAVRSRAEIRDLNDVLQAVNSDASVQGSDNIKSYKLLFDAYLKLSDPPTPVGGNFNSLTIYPGMSDWPAVSGWAESNPDMSKAILDAGARVIVGLPYGEENVDSQYREADLCVAMGVDGSLRNIDFRYLHAVDVISAYATAEMYRLLEADRVDDGLKMAVAHIFVLRQFCDRQFLAEKEFAIQRLIDALTGMRNVFYTHFDKISAEWFAKLAMDEIPYLRPDRARLTMPEGDRIIAEALIREAFANEASPDPQQFADTYAKVQAEEGPLTIFGASKRWSMIALVHGSLEASLDRLKLVYDDWWRRWRVREWDPILDIPTQFERINQVRYAAVIYSMHNIEHLFKMRNQLVVGVNGTAMASGLCGYKKAYGTWPNEIVMIYAQFAHKSSNTDPYDRDYGAFKFRFFSAEQPVDTPAGRIWIPANEAVLYSVGQNLRDDLITNHTDNGAGGDLIIWPAVRAMQREKNLVD